MPYYLGIDGGGSKTTCAVGDDCTLLAQATAGPSNVVRVGEAQARESLHQAAHQACAAAGIALSQIAQTCVGGSGAARPEIAAIIRRALAEILSTPIQVVGDMEIALNAAFDAGPGVIIIAGTGSIAYGRDPQGSIARAGGWGFAIGDEGSAHWIGRTAIAAVLRDSDRSNDPSKSPHARLAAALCQAWGVNSLLDLARVANSIPPPDFAALFPTVAASHDALALQVLLSAGVQLAQTAAVVIDRLFTMGKVKVVPVAMIGSVFRHAGAARENFYNELRKLDRRVEINTQIVEPIEGALRLARRAAAHPSP